MKIERLVINRLYGGFSKEVVFRDGLNLLVGINGSGKTSVLNCIEWMLKPDLPRLACTMFHSIVLEFSRGGRHFEIQAKRTTSALRVSVFGDGFPRSELTVKIERPASSIKSEEDLAVAMRDYDGLGPESHERRVWEFLKEIQKPLAISLDRSIAAETEGDYFIELGGKRLHSKARSPIDKVLNVTRTRLASYREKMLTRNEQLKARVVLSAFKSPFSKIEDARLSPVTAQQLDALQSKVTALLYSSDEIEEAVAGTIRAYFEDAKKIVRYGSNANMQMIFKTQYEQLLDMADAFNEHESLANAAYEPIREYLSTLNSFFKDSGKEIGFNDQDGTLAFRLIGQNGDPTGSYLSIDRLSSGERQILIIMTFIAFVARKNQVFIVDEPELSLHPRWQRTFVDGVVKHSPPGTQIIMATHSPEIVAKHREKCVVLDV